jgi:hypothetical protein
MLARSLRSLSARGAWLRSESALASRLSARAGIQAPSGSNPARRLAPSCSSREFQNIDAQYIMSADLPPEERRLAILADILEKQRLEGATGEAEAYRLAMSPDDLSALRWLLKHSFVIQDTHGYRLNYSGLWILATSGGDLGRSASGILADCRKLVGPEGHLAWAYTKDYKRSWAVGEIASHAEMEDRQAQLALWFISRVVSIYSTMSSDDLGRPTSMRISDQIREIRSVDEHVTSDADTWAREWRGEQQPDPFDFEVFAAQETPKQEFDRHLQSHYGLTRKALRRRVSSAVTASGRALRRILVRDIEHAVQLVEIGIHKPALVLAGAAIEACLTELLQQAPSTNVAAAISQVCGKAKSPGDLKFSELIEVAERIQLLAPPIAKALHSARNYRNFVHPHAEMKQQTTIGVNEAQLALRALFMLLNA